MFFFPFFVFCFCFYKCVAVFTSSTDDEDAVNESDEVTKMTCMATTLLLSMLNTFFFFFVCFSLCYSILLSLCAHPSFRTEC